MNKVLILTLMMLSFISKDGRSREETTPTPTGAAKEIQQNTSKIQIKPQNQNKTTNRTEDTKAPTTTAGKKQNKKQNKTKKETDLLTKNKGKILTFLATIITACAIFTIYHLKGEKQKLEQQQKCDLIKTDLKGKSCEKIFKALGLGLPDKMTLHELELLTSAIIQEKKSPELTGIQKIIIEVLEWMKDIDGYKSGNGEELKNWIAYFIGNNMTEVTTNRNGGVTFFNSHNNDKYTVHYYNNLKPIGNQIEKIKNLINAILKLKNILLNPDPDKINFTFREIYHLFGIDYYNHTLPKTPFKANEYIQGLQRILNETLENNRDTIEKLLKARSDIENAIQESGSNELKKPGLCLMFRLNLGCFSLCYILGDYQSCGGKNNNHIGINGSSRGSIICSDLCQRLIQDLKGTDPQTIQNTLNKICEIIGALNEEVIRKTWGQTIIPEINKQLPQ